MPKAPSDRSRKPPNQRRTPAAKAAQAMDSDLTDEISHLHPRSLYDSTTPTSLSTVFGDRGEVGAGCEGGQENQRSGNDSNEPESHDNMDDGDNTWLISQQTTSLTTQRPNLSSHSQALANGTIDHPLSNANGNEKSWLEHCRNAQDAKFPLQKHRKDEQGIWELDLLHNQHECYNAYLFISLRPSALEEQNAPAPVHGYGTVRLKVLYDKSSTQWTYLSLENVAYVHAQDTNHRIGLGALPKAIHLHLPQSDEFSVQGDGFLSIANGVGCALGNINQGGRRVWTLRTLSLQSQVSNVFGGSRSGFLFGWGGGNSNQTIKKEEDKDNEIKK